MSSGNAEARLASLLDSAMDAIISVDESQRIVLCNQAAERIFGWPRAELLGHSLQLLIPQRFQAHHAEHVRRFGETGVTSRRMSGSSVVYGVRKNGEEFPVDASISQVSRPDGKLFTVMLRDATERVRAEQEQARLAARLSGLLESAMDAIITVDDRQCIVLYNRAAERIFGWPSAQVIGCPLDMLMPARFRASHRGQVRHFRETGVSSRRMGGSSLIYGLRADGEEFPMDASISQLDSPDGWLYTVILRDVSERIRSQRDLTALAAEAAGVREQEKSRIARELHHELEQTLTALKMDMSWLRANERLDLAALRGKLDAMTSVVDEAVASTRRIAADLRPLVLDDLGLVPAIEWLTQNFSQRHFVPCHLDADEEIELQEPYATGVFRIVQEALNNVAKHARATHVEVHLRRTAGLLVVSVQDDGVGFLVSAERKPNSVGLVGIRERAQLLRGEVRMTSSAGAGTRVEAIIPLVDDPINHREV